MEICGSAAWRELVGCSWGAGGRACLWVMRMAGWQLAGQLETGFWRFIPAHASHSLFTPRPLLPCPQNQLRVRHGETASRPLVLTSKGRADVLLSLTAAHVTGTGPHVAGIILTDAGRTVG